MAGWNPQEPKYIEKDEIELVNKEFWKGNKSVMQSYHRNQMIASMAHEILSLRNQVKKREGDVHFFIGLLADLRTYNAFRENSMTERELQGYDNYERRLFEAVTNKINETIAKMHEYLNRPLDAQVSVK